MYRKTSRNAFTFQDMRLFLYIKTKRIMQEFLNGLYVFGLFLSIFNVLRNALLFTIALWTNTKYGESKIETILFALSFAYVSTAIYYLFK